MTVSERRTLTPQNVKNIAAANQRQTQDMCPGSQSDYRHFAYIARNRLHAIAGLAAWPPRLLAVEKQFNCCVSFCGTTATGMISHAESLWLRVVIAIVHSLCRTAASP
jgi:hypothetical protein